MVYSSFSKSSFASSCTDGIDESKNIGIPYELGALSTFFFLFVLFQVDMVICCWWPGTEKVVFPIFPLLLLK